MYRPANKEIWKGRVDANEGLSGLRWHQVINYIDLSLDQLPELASNEKGIVLLGFMSDEGVRRNKGRIGAKDGPDTLRKACCNHADHFEKNTAVLDGGNVICENQDLEAAQIELSVYVSKIVSANYFPMLFGGGHEIAYPHFLGLSQANHTNKILGIVNIDAHFDLRLPESESSSGTPFYDISIACEKAAIPFNYLCLGIQRSANTRALFNQADKLGVHYVYAHDLAISSSLEKLKDFIKTVDQIYLTICLDAFDISFAPGVSAPTATGLYPDIALKIIQEITDSKKLISADIAELNPALDHHEITAKLASKFVFEIISDL